MLDIETSVGTSVATLDYPSNSSQYIILRLYVFSRHIASVSHKKYLSKSSRIFHLFRYSSDAHRKERKIEKLLYFSYKWDILPQN